MEVRMMVVNVVVIVEKKEELRGILGGDENGDVGDWRGGGIWEGDVAAELGGAIAGEKEATGGGWLGGGTSLR